MKVHNYHEWPTFYAAEDIKEGDLLTKTVGKRLRRSKPQDAHIVGVAMYDYKKGEEITDSCLCAEYQIFKQSP